MPEAKRRALFDYRGYFPWLEKLGFGEDDLRRIPVHEAPDTEGASIGLGYVSPGAPPAVPGELEAAGTRQLYVYERDVPHDLWARLRAATYQPQRSGYPKEDMFTGVPDVIVTDEERPQAIYRAVKGRIGPMGLGRHGG